MPGNVGPGVGSAYTIPRSSSRFSHRDHRKSAIVDCISNHSATQLVHSGEHSSLSPPLSQKGQSVVEL